MEKLLLFDIDGTLTSTGGAGVRSLTRAFEELFGISQAFRSISMSGKTDPLIVEEALNLHGLDYHQDDITRLQERYIRVLTEEIKKDAPGKRLMPGIRELLTCCAAQKNCILALLTGNWKFGAAVKLNYFDIAHFFQFGVFADDSAIRSEMVPIALKRCRLLTGKEPEIAQVYVIGDTPRDVQAAAPHGVVTVAVATGKYSMSELQVFQPDYLFQDFSDFMGFCRIVSEDQ